MEAHSDATKRWGITQLFTPKSHPPTNEQTDGKPTIPGRQSAVFPIAREWLLVMHQNCIFILHHLRYAYFRPLHRQQRPSSTYIMHYPPNTTARRPQRRKVGTCTAAMLYGWMCINMRINIRICHRLCVFSLTRIVQVDASSPDSARIGGVFGCYCS